MVSATGKRVSASQMNFAQKVFFVVSKIPRGETLTYKEVAQKAGRPNAYRAVGNILNKNYDPKIPCHRIIRSDGTIGGYNRGAKKKLELLKKESILKELCKRKTPAVASV